MDVAQENEIYLALIPSESQDAFAAAPSDEHGAARHVAQGIIQRIPDVISRWRDFITTDLLLAIARKAYDFALNRLPIPIPDSIREAVWQIVAEYIHDALAAGS